MKTFKVKHINETEIVLRGIDQLPELFSKIESEENFMVEFEDNGKKQRKLIIGATLTGKVDSGEFKLSAMED